MIDEQYSQLLGNVPKLSMFALVLGLGLGCCLELIRDRYRETLE